MAIVHQIRPKFKNRNDEIISELCQAAGALPAGDPMTIIKRKTAEIAIAMAVLHGGEWRVQIDHEEGFVYVTRRLQCSRK